MQLLIDGSNVLGRMRVDRESGEHKRSLVTSVASFCRRTKSKAWCFFDGERPASFGTSLGALQVIFSGPSDADSLMVKKSLEIKGDLLCVTSDGALGGRIRSRRCEVRTSEWLIGELAANPDRDNDFGDDWELYFSDGKNRNV